MKRTKILFLRYFMATLGMLLVAMGIALSIKSNLGTSPLSCPSYVLNLKFPGISVGMFTVLVNISYILIQLAVLRKRFEPQYLMQVLASAIFGSLIDLCLWTLIWMEPAGFTYRLFLAFVSCLITAVGVSLEVVSRAWMLSAEMTVYAFVKAFKLQFGTTKVWMDSLIVVISLVLSYIFFANPFGAGEFTSFEDVLLARTPGVVIGLGTLMSALLVGWMMKFTDPVVNRVCGKIFDETKGATAI